MKIAIDAGHGPNTPGKRCPDDSMREFAFNSVVARYARDGLAEYSEVVTLFTHADDGSRDVPLKERTDAANAWKADIFVSIHANAMGDGWDDKGVGIETFTYTTKDAASVQLATAVNTKVVALTGRKNRGVKAADFHVLRETKMPAILVECGFMTSHEEAALLKTDAYRKKCAEAIVTGIAEAYGLKRKGETVVTVLGGDIPQWKRAIFDQAKAAGIVTSDEWLAKMDDAAPVWLVLATVINASKTKQA